MKNKTNLTYQEEKLSDILKFYADSFTPPDGKIITSVVPVSVDTNKDTVVFRIFTKDDK